MGQFDGRLSLRPRLVAFATAGAAVLSLLTFLALQHAPNPAAETGKTAELRVAEDYGKLPMSFEPNAGRTDARADFISRGSGYSLFLTSTGAVMDLATSKTRGHVLSMKLLGANEAAPANGLEKLPGTANSLVGRDPSNWTQNLPTYERVRYEDVYPGIGVEWYGSRDNAIEHDFRIAPGADPGLIKVRMRGADSLNLAPNGDLLIGASGKTLRQRAPEAFQQIEGERRSVQSAYELRDGVVSFRLGAYDHSRPLTIDPIILAYSTFLGGSSTDLARSIDFDYQGDAYVFGTTSSTDFPTTPGGFDSTHPGADADGFVTKLSSSGTFLIYSTYLGGAGLENIGDGNVDLETGEVYLTGRTQSTDFPTTATSYSQTFIGGTDDAFVTRLNASGSAPTYSTYFGGTLVDRGDGIATDDGDLIIGGTTTSTDLPLVNSIQGHIASNDAFVSRIDPDVDGAAGVKYSTQLGGVASDEVLDIVQDPEFDRTHIVGFTTASGFAPDGVFDNSYNGGAADGIIAAIDTELSGANSLVYRNYFGGNQADRIYTVDVQPESPYLVIAGETGSNTGFPLAGGPGGSPTGGFDGSYGGGFVDGFVAKLIRNPSDDPELTYSTYLGGGGDDRVTGLDVDPDGTAYSVGTTSSSGFPVTGGGLDTTLAPGDTDAFVTTLSMFGDNLGFSTFLGGAAVDLAAGVGIDPSGQIYVVGSTFSSDFPTSADAFDSSFGAPQESFVTRLSLTEFINGSPLNILVSRRGRLAVSLDSEPGLEVDADANGARAGLTLGFAGGQSIGAFGANGGFLQLAPSNLEVDGNTFKLTTKYGTYASGTADPRITETHTYINGEMSFTTDYEFENLETTASAFRATIAADLSTDLEDQGVGQFVPGSPRFVGSLSDPYQTGDGLEEIRGWSAYEEGAAGNVISDIQSPGGPGLSNTADESTHDTMSAAQWDDYRSTGLPAGASDTFQVRWAFRRVPRPQHGQRFVVRPVSGTVRVDAPTAAPINLEDPRRVPVGTEVDTRNGVAEVDAERRDGTDDTARFWDGQFLTEQNGRGANPFVAKLSGPCGRGGTGGKKGKGKQRIATAASGGSRKLWGKGTGSFRTKGYRGSATVRGTNWLTTDRCKGKERSTTFRVLEGVLAIDEFSSKGAVDKILRKGSYKVPSGGKKK